MRRRWSRSAAALGGLAVAFALGACEGAFETSDGTVDDGNEALVAGQAELAVQRYAEAAAELPETPQLNLNRGLALVQAGKYDDGVQRLLRALDSRDKAFLHQVHAALGDAYARWALSIEKAPQPAPDKEHEGEPAEKPKNPALPTWQKAVEHLEEALLDDPGDAASLRNLEVALLRVDPPCATRDDELERNNGLESASPIAPSGDKAPLQSGVQAPSPEMAKDKLTWTRQLYSCPEDPDWYALEVSPGDRVAVALTVPEKTGRLGLDMTGLDGESRLPPAADGDAPTTKIERTVTAADGDKLWFRVDNLDLEEVSYGLDVAVRPACEKTEDRFEPNDDEAHAALLTPGPVPGLKLCPGNDDWFAVDLAEGESLFLFAQTTPNPDEADKAKDAPKDAPPPILTEIHDAEGKLLATGGPTGAGRVTTLLTPGPGRYFLKVSGEAAFEGRYDLMVNVVPPCPEGDDAYEDNDRVEDAVDFVQAAQEQQQQAQPGGGTPGGPGGQAQGPPTLFLRVCPGDEDWFKFTQSDDKPMVISAIFEHDKGDLELGLFDAAGLEEKVRADGSDAAHNGEALAVPPRPKPEPAAAAGAGGGASAPPPGDEAEPEPVPWTLRVRGKEGSQNFYILRLDHPEGGGQQQQDDKDQDQDKDKGDKDKKDDQDKADKDKKDDQDEQGDQDKDKKEQQEQKSEPFQDALDKLDRNPENLEAAESARKSPLSHHRPRKDW